MEDLYGQRLAGIFGYSHLLGARRFSRIALRHAFVPGYHTTIAFAGGYAGLQAEYARVPLGTLLLDRLILRALITSLRAQLTTAY